MHEASTARHAVPAIEHGTPEDPITVDVTSLLDDERYLLRARMEIVYVLRSLARTGALVKVHCGGDSKDFLLTSLLSVDNDAGLLIFEASGSPTLNRRILEAERLSFFTSLDKVHIHFRTTRAQSVTHDRHGAFSTALPQELLRLQRREYYRMVTPLSRPIACTIPLPDEESIKHVEARVQDISLGGVCLALPATGPGLEASKEYANCRIVLPDAGNMVTPLAVRHAITVTLLNGKVSRRYGCMFTRPSAAALALVQRYILKLERERRSDE